MHCCQAWCKGIACGRGGRRWQWLDFGGGQRDRIVVFKHSRTAKQSMGISCPRGPNREDLPMAELTGRETLEQQIQIWAGRLCDLPEPGGVR